MALFSGLKNPASDESLWLNTSFQRESVAIGCSTNDDVHVLTVKNV